MNALEIDKALFENFSQVEVWLMVSR